MLYGGADYFVRANETIVTMAMIETRAALHNLDEIMTVKGLHGVYVGPSDLSIGLGHPPSLDVTHPEINAAIAEIVKAANRNEIKAGIHCPSGEVARQWSQKGFRFCTLSTDARILAQGARAELTAARKM